MILFRKFYLRFLFPKIMGSIKIGFLSAVLQRGDAKRSLFLSINMISIKRFVLCLTFLTLCLGKLSFGKDLKIFAEKNKFGGDTVEIKFKEGDAEYKFKKNLKYYDREGYKVKEEKQWFLNDYNNQGINKSVETYDKGGRLRQVELFFREDKSREIGFSKISLFLDKAGNKIRMGVFFIEETDRNQVYSKSISYYDKIGLKIRVEYFFNQKTSELTGYYRIEETYDRRGRMRKQTIYDREGNSY